MDKINQIHSIEDNGTYQLLPQISIYDGYHIEFHPPNENRI